MDVIKRRHPDEFLLTYALDGFSPGTDFKVADKSGVWLSELLQDLDRIILSAGIQFYFAKNSETSAESMRAYLGDTVIAKSMNFKKHCDPYNLLDPDLYH